VAAAATLVSAQDLFLHPRGFFIGPDATITVPVFDGSFARSARAIAPERLVDLSLRGPTGRTPIDRAAWSGGDPRSTVRVRVGGPGTYVLGVALAPRTGAGASPVESAKTILTVTDGGGLVVARAGAASAATDVFGYAVELVPLADPYAVGIRGTLPVRALLDGKPLVGAIVLAGGTVGTSTDPIPAQRLTTDAGGRVSVHLTHDGHWFVTLVHRRAATLTFGVLP
jgi:hypothetical protein